MFRFPRVMRAVITLPFNQILIYFPVAWPLHTIIKARVEVILLEGIAQLSRRSVASDVARWSMHVWHPICVDSCTKGRRNYARRS